MAGIECRRDIHRYALELMCQQAETSLTHALRITRSNIGFTYAYVG
jgi:hypothetical protein